MGIIILKIILVFIGLLIFGSTIDWLLNRKKLLFLSQITPQFMASAPLVSIVFSACNEEDEIESAVRSFLKQDYPSLEIIAIDDRSIDSTAKILQKLSSQNPQINYLHIDYLPPNWLGKNHALWRGGIEAKGEWILFTDGDVRMHPETVRQSIAYAEENKVDHLVVIPRIEVDTLIEHSALLAFQFLVNFQARPWKLRDKNSKDALGIGAFNLIRTAVYQKIGTHKALSLSVIDDMDLGRLVKKNGFKQDALGGSERVQLKWQKNWWGIVTGLEKNFFAGLQFSLFIAAVSLLSIFSFAFAPIVGLFVLHGGWFIWTVGIWGSLFISYLGAKKFNDSPLLSFFLTPLGLMTMALALVRSTYITLANRGITWRGTFYPLALFPKPTWKKVIQTFQRNY